MKALKFFLPVLCAFMFAVPAFALVADDYGTVLRLPEVIARRFP